VFQVLGKRVIFYGQIILDAFCNIIYFDLLRQVKTAVRKLYLVFDRYNVFQKVFADELGIVCKLRI